MITLIIFKSNARGMQYGMGTYIRELTGSLLSYPDIKIYVVTYHNSRFKEFNIAVLAERYFEINIPTPKLSLLHDSRNEIKYARAVANLLADIISENEGIIFHMNYIDDLPIMKILRERYEYSVISVVHFFQWEQLFNGNKQKMNGLNIDKPSNNTEFTIFTEKEMLRLSDHVVTINPFMKDFLIKKYNIPPVKISMIRNGINIGRFTKTDSQEKIRLKHKLGFYSHEKIILFCGRIDPDKGINFLVDAFTKACKIKDDLRLVLIGQGYIQDILDKCKQFYGRITFTGFLSPDKIKEFYQIADIGVVPSIYEPCSYSRLEMIASGIPLILTRIEGFSDMSEGEQCIFINRHITHDGDILFDTDEFCNAILSLSGNDKLAETIASNAYRDLLNKNSASDMAKDMIRLYKNLIKNKKPDLEYEKTERR